jgi:hypothetical protein
MSRVADCAIRRTLTSGAVICETYLSFAEKATLISEHGLYLMPATTYSPTHVWRGRPRPRKQLSPPEIPFREELKVNLFGRH